MNRNGKRQLVLGAAIVALAAAWAGPRQWGRTGPTAAHAARSVTHPAAVEPTVGAAFAAAEDAERAFRAEKDRPWPIEPFVPLPEPTPPAAGAGNATAAFAAQGSAYFIRAIVTGDPPRAVINERLVTVGDRLPNGAVVLDISASAVTLSGAQGSVTIPLVD